MSLGAFQLHKSTLKTNQSDLLHNTPLITYGRVIKVIDIHTVLVKTIVQSSLSVEMYAVTLLSLSSALLEVSNYPKVGDTVLLLFLQRYNPSMFIEEVVHDAYAVGYNKYSGVGILVSNVKAAASTLCSFYEDGGEPIAAITGNAEVRGDFHRPVTLSFSEDTLGSGDEALTSIIFGENRPLLSQHLARTTRTYGFWKTVDNEWQELDAGINEQYSVFAPVTKNIQGSQTIDVGLGTDKDDNPVETDAPLIETVHGRAPITKIIRSPQTIQIGIGNDASGDAGEQRDAPVTVSLGENADISLVSKSAKTAHYEKDVKETIGGNREETVTGSAKYTSADTDIKSDAPVGINDGLYTSALKPYFNEETSALDALMQAAVKAAPQLAVLDGLSGGTGFITGLGTAIITFCTSMKANDTSAHTSVSKAVK